MIKLGLNRDQYNFLSNHDQIDQFERLFRRANEVPMYVDGGNITTATVLPVIEQGETVSTIYKNTSGVAVNVSLPTTGTYNYRYLANGGTGVVGRAVTSSVIASLGAGVAAEIVYTRL